MKIITSEDEDEDDTSCPICKEKECKKHLLARFDASGDSGLFGIGLEEGPLCEANEIEEVLRRTRLVWVRSARATGKPKAPEWIIKERDLRAYFDALGGLGGSDLEKYDSDEDAAGELQVETDHEIWHAREEFLWWSLSSCGWLGGKTEEPFDPRTVYHVPELVGLQAARDRRKTEGETSKGPVGSRQLMKVTKRKSSPV